MENLKICIFWNVLNIYKKWNKIRGSFVVGGMGRGEKRLFGKYSKFMFCYEYFKFIDELYSVEEEGITNWFYEEKFKYFFKRVGCRDVEMGCIVFFWFF